MEQAGKTHDPLQVQRLEEISFHAINALELCAEMGDFQSSLAKFKNRKDIFERAVQGLRRALPVSFYAFYSVDDTNFDIRLEHTDAPEKRDYLQDTVEHLIEKGAVARAFREKRSLQEFSWDGRYPMLIHSVETTSRTSGIFFCFLEEKPAEPTVARKITTIIIKATSYALANFDLYLLLEQKNSELREKNLQISNSSVVYRNTFENTGNPMAVVDSLGAVAYSNSQFSDFSGFCREDLSGGKNIADFIELDEDKGFSDLLGDPGCCPEDSPPEYTFINSAGERKTVFLKISPLGMKGRYIVSINDVTPLKEAEKKLEFQAFHDPLTHLPNRALFQDRLRQAVKKKKRYSGYEFAVVFIDLDRFKAINDSMGHHVGDQLLVRTAERMKASVRETDTVARFGGDEFILLLEDVPDEEACDAMVQRILEEFQAPLEVEGREIVVALSMGVLVSSRENPEQSDMVRLADISMYEAKKKGCRRVVYSHEISGREIQKKLYLESHMQNALRKGEFFIHYQPLVELFSGRLYGVEALARWRHPELGIVPPGSFIPIAEDSGLIIPLGQQIIEMAFRDLAGWREKYEYADDMRLNINLSVKQFAKEDLAEDIRRAACRTGAPLEKVTLEITESIFIEDAENALRVIGKLRELGISISIDDFGTGYSSLRYLNEFPVDLVKIDRILIRDIAGSRTDRSIVASMLELCGKLDLNVLAEGIEEPAQLEKLRQMNCRFGQGYYFAAPQDKTRIEEIINRRYFT